MATIEGSLTGFSLWLSAALRAADNHKPKSLTIKNRRRWKAPPVFYC
jgi:hypothetical protein